HFSLEFRQDRADPTQVVASMDPNSPLSASNIDMRARSGFQRELRKVVTRRD
ncbi:hypothetical protein HK405_002333, partial [Cladochytrium tenue]